MHMICVAEDADRENNFTRNSDVSLCALNFNTYKLQCKHVFEDARGPDSKRQKSTITPHKIDPKVWNITLAKSTLLSVRCEMWSICLFSQRIWHNDKKKIKKVEDKPNVLKIYLFLNHGNCNI